MNEDITILLKLSACFLALFGLAELLYAVVKVKAENTRKLVHTGTGLLTLLFPVYFQHLWQVVVICLAFLVLLMFSKRFGFLQSINGIARKSSGSTLYPVVVIVIFAFYLHMSAEKAMFEGLLYFYMPVLLMAICDPVAAITGNAYKQRHPTKARKTRAGSTGFFISATLLSVVLFAAMDTGSAGIYTVVLAIGMGGVTTMAERLAGGGWDNFTIPVSSAAFLYLINILAI